MLETLASGNFDPFAINPAEAAGKDSRSRCADVVRQANATEGNVCGHLCVERRIIPEGSASKIRFDRTRSDHVDPDPARSEFLSEVPGKDLDGSFGCSVSRIPGRRKPRETCRDIEDGTAINNKREKLLGQEERPFEMNRHKLVELIFSRLGERCINSQASVVDEEIEVRALERFLECRSNLTGKRAERSCLAGVKLEHRGACSSFFDESNNRSGFVLPAAVGSKNADAAFSKMKGHTPADTSAGACYERHRAVGGNGRDNFCLNVIVRHERKV